MFLNRKIKILKKEVSGLFSFWDDSGFQMFDSKKTS